MKLLCVLFLTTSCFATMPIRDMRGCEGLSFAEMAQRAQRVVLAPGMPSEIKVGKVTFKVVRKKGAEMCSLYGLTEYAKHTITIADDLEFADERETFLHELCHLAARMKRPVEFEDFDEDDAIETFAPGLVIILEQNPKLAKYLSGR